MTTIHDWTLDDLEDRWRELADAYVLDDGILCPLLNPAPIPTLAEARSHLEAGQRLLESRNAAGELTTVQLVDTSTGLHRIRACWGPVDPDAMLEAQLGAGGFLEHYAGEGRPWLLDTGAEGWVARRYFRDYCTPSGPFDTTRSDHPGLAGELLAAYDRIQWRLVIEPAAPNELAAWVHPGGPELVWRYELLE